MKRIYQPTENSRLSEKDAQIVGKQLEAIEARRGCLTPETVVNEARAKKSPLHRFFEWDDSAAAEAYRKDQARALIRSVTVTIIDEPEAPPVRAFVSVTSCATEKRFEGSAYISTVRALTTDDYRAQVLAKARDELAAWRQRYKNLEEFARVFEAADSVLA